MIKRILFCGVVCAFVEISNPVIANGQRVDLVSGMLDAKAICTLSLDQVTEILGRPSVVDQNRLVADVIGPALFYHPRGMTVRFRPGPTGQQRILLVSLQLARTWDEKNLEWFSAFVGELVPDAKADWTAHRTLTEFAEYNPIEVTPEVRRRELQDAGIPLPARIDHVVRLEFERHTVTFLHEPTTRFLEGITVICK